MEHVIKCAVCHITEVGFMNLNEGQEYPGDDACCLVCESCIQISNVPEE